MRNKKVKDERIIQVQNKILGEAYFVTVLLLFISILVKAYAVSYTHLDVYKRQGLKYGPINS